VGASGIEGTSTAPLPRDDRDDSDLNDARNVERRLQRVEDRIELSDLVARYGVAVDDRDEATLRELFARDATFTGVRGETRGRDAVVAYYLERFRTFGPSFHVPHSQTVTFDGDDAATGVVSAHAELAGADGAFWVALRYLDVYVREDGAWRFASRAIRQLYALPLRELADHLGAPDRVRWPGTDPRAADLPTWDADLASSASQNEHRRDG
jgi:uncharacterized protein (TIGR02246 family)